MSTTFPIDVTVDRLVEFHDLADVLCLAEIGRLPTHKAGDQVAEIILLKAMQGETAQQIQAWLHDQQEAVAHRAKPPARVAARAPSLAQRVALPPFPSGSFVKDMPWTPPKSRDFLRANAWGITIPGAPFVPGGSSKRPERILSWFLDRFPPDIQQKWLDQNNLNGYTHVIQSAADSLGPRDNGPASPPGAAQSLDQFVATCKRIKQEGLFVTVFLGSKYFQPRDMGTAQWIAFVDPIMDALISADVVDEFVPGWEWDLWNVPGKITVDVFKHVGQKAHAAGKTCWIHFSSEKTSWFANGDSRGRFGFYDDLGADVDGLMYQTIPTWSMTDTQARIVDTLHQFGDQGNRQKLRFFEDQATLMFDGDTPTETDADMRGFLACCTVDNVKHTDAKVWGYGNGARRPDGTAL